MIESKHVKGYLLILPNTLEFLIIIYVKFDEGLSTYILDPACVSSSACEPSSVHVPSPFTFSILELSSSSNSSPYIIDKYSSSYNDSEMKTQLHLLHLLLQIIPLNLNLH